MFQNFLVVVVFCFLKKTCREQASVREKMAGGGDVDEEEQLRESLKNHPHLTLDELREFKELFNLVRAVATFWNSLAACLCHYSVPYMYVDGLAYVPVCRLGWID